MKRLALITAFLFALPLQAAQFQAPLTDTQWELVNTPLECGLKQTIPGFGEAGFYRRNGGPLQLSFQTHTQPAEQSKVHFRVATAPWQHSQTDAKALSTMPTNQGQTRFMIQDRPAMEALTQLQEGRFTFIEYRSQMYPSEIQVMLSTVKLNDSLPDFQRCLSSLHTDTFNDVSKLTVYFGLEQATLDAASKQALSRLANYAKLDKSISQIRISSHTDSHGRKRLNEPLSDARAHAVRQFLVQEHGIADELIEVQSNIDFKPAASNKTIEGRALNRRAEITLIR
jgi:outer membrane protein OmpA-like peptidoglycan-associated protein